MFLLKDLILTYNKNNYEKCIFDSAEISFDHGSINGIFGDNGSGKSSLGLIVCGALSRFLNFEYEVSIYFNNKKVTDDFLLSNSTYVFQNPYSYFVGNSIAEEVSLFNNRKREIEQIINSISASRGYNTLINTLSQGQQQLLATCSALLTNRQIIILDEPFAFLDKENRKIAKKFIADARNDQKIVILLCNDEDKDYYDICDNKWKIHDKLIHKNNASFAKRTISFPQHVSAENDTSNYSVKSLDFKYAGQDNLLFEKLEYNTGPGQITLIYGKNGAGKTTLMKLFCGLLKPKRGLFMVNANLLKWKELKNYTRCVFQFPDNQLFCTTVEDEYKWELTHATYTNKLCHIDVRGIFEPSRNPFEMSFGERKLLTILLAFINFHSLVCIDEPFVGLDRNSKIIVAKVINQYISLGGALVISSPNQNESYDGIAKCIYLD